MPTDFFMFLCAQILQICYKVSTEMCWSLKKAWQAQWKMLVCSLDEVWSASRRSAPQVAQPKHLLCEFPVGGVSSAYLAGPSWKTTPSATRVPSCARVHSEAPLFCAWVSDVMPRLRSLCAHRKHSAVSGTRQADFPIPCLRLRCSTNLSASIFGHQNCGMPFLFHYPHANPSLGSKVGTTDDSAVIGCNYCTWQESPTNSTALHSHCANLRWPDTLPHTCFPF